MHGLVCEECISSTAARRNPVGWSQQASVLAVMYAASSAEGASSKTLLLQDENDFRVSDPVACNNCGLFPDEASHGTGTRHSNNLAA